MMRYLIPLVLLLAGCELAGSESGTGVMVRTDTGIMVRTDRDAYAVQDTVHFTISNQSNETILVSSSCVGVGYSIDRWAGSQWVQVGTSPPAVCPAIFGPNMMLKPGDSVSGFALAEIRGTLRLRFEVSRDDAKSTGAFNTASNSFHVGE